MSDNEYIYQCWCGQKHPVGDRHERMKKPETQSGGSLKPVGSTIEDLRRTHLESLLDRGEAWRCAACGQINGNRNRQCCKCYTWPNKEVSDDAH